MRVTDHNGEDTGQAARPPNVRDVAKLAGVSHQTVSRVLNEHANVREATRDRVLRAIEELGYRTNIAARTLSTQRSGIIGVISLDTTIYGPASMLFGVAQAARDAGYFVSLASIKVLNRKSLQDAFDMLRNQNPEGIVVLAPQRASLGPISEFARGLPVVALHADPGDNLPVVTVDDYGGARRATDYLLQLGHQTVWHVAGPTDWPEATARSKGWQDALTAAGRAVPPVLYGDWSAASGYELGLKLTRQDDVTAVFAANDQLALGILGALHSQGISVPQDVSVVGFDDIAQAPYFVPALTTVRVNYDLLVVKIMEAMLAQVNGEAREEVSAPTPADLILRASSAPPGRR